MSSVGMNIVATATAPKAIGPYSQAIRLGNMLFCSGQIPLDATTMQIAGTTVEAQTEQVFKNITEVLKAAGTNLKQVVKTTVFLKNMSDFEKMNAIYAQQFGDHKPARSTVEVARLPKDVLVEIECIAGIA